MKRKKKEPTGPKEGDWLPPIPGVRDEWHRVALVMRGKVMGVEVWHGDPPVESTPKKASKWAPPPRNPMEMSPVVEKFLSWRFQPAVRPTAKGLTGRRKDRYLRLALVQKRSNWYADWGKSWSDLSKTGATDDELMKIVNQEFGASGLRNPQDKRRVAISFYRKGKQAVFIIGAPDDPDRYVLEGVELLCAVRRVMNIKRNY